MSGLLTSLAWCSLQVTLVALLAWLLCGLARRTSSGPAAALPATALAAVIVLTVLAFSPWPRSWSYGPELGWQSKVSSPSGANNFEENAPTLSPFEDKLPIAPNLTPQPTLGETEVTTTEEHSLVGPDRGVVPVASRASASDPLPASADSTTASTPLPRPWPWPAILISLLALGAAAGLLQLLLGLAAAGSYRRKSLLIEDKALHELADVLCAQLRCRARIELRETSALATAATIGWRKPLVLLPLEWRDWTPEHLRAVLAHEIAHIARHDFLACVLAQASLALHFYHPLVHWLVHRLRLEQELAADAAAAAATGGRASYLQALAELALHQSERPLGWPARTFLPTRGTFMRRIEMLRDAKNGPAENSRWLTWPRQVAVLLLIVGAMAVAGLRGAAPPTDVAQAQDKPKAAEETAEATPDSGTVNIAHLPNDSLAIAVLRIQPLLRNPETAEILRGLDRRTAASRAAAPLEKIQQVALVLRSDEPLPRSEPIIVVEASQSIDFSLALRLEGENDPPPEEVKEADLKDGLDRPQLVFVRLGEKAAALSSRRSLAWFLAAKRGNPGLAGGDGWKMVSSRPLVVGLDMMAARKLTPVDEGSHFKRMGLGPIWDETETVAAGINLGKKADLLMVADCLGEKGAKEVRETVDAGAIMVRNMLREVRSARLRQGADNLGARTVAEPEFVQFLYDAADKALSNVKVKQEGDTLISAQASVDLKGRLGTLSNLVPSVEALRANSRKSQSANNLKQIMLAMHNYADTYGSQFPPAILYGKDGEGKFPHSWRVALLPYLDQEALYRQYKFDEPWDSEANRKVLTQMPPAFRASSADPKSTTSSYYVLVGKAAEVKRGEEGGGAGAAGPPAGATPIGGAAGAGGAIGLAGGFAGFVVDTGLPTAFSKKGGKEGIRFAEMTDGTSNTLAVVEAKRDIPWTKPEDIAYDPKGKAPMLGGIYDDGFWVGVCDGSVRFLPAKTDADFLRAFLSPAGGEVLPVDPPAGAEGARPVPVPTKRDAPRAAANSFIALVRPDGANGCSGWRVRHSVGANLQPLSFLAAADGLLVIAAPRAQNRRTAFQYPPLPEQSMSRTSRRKFLAASTAAAASTAFSFTIVPRHVLGGVGQTPPSERVNIGGVGAGGMGGGDISTVAKLGCNVVALCDVDEQRGAGLFNAFPKAKRYKDFREMIDKEAKNIDAVTVGTPDHIHAVASMAAIKAGKHVYTQKPLTHTLVEARELTKAAAKAKVMTSMGNQGHASEGSRLTNEWIQAGVIGDVREVHCWSDRAGRLWKQGLGRPTDSPPIPKTLDWDLWLGPVKERPYNPAYCPFAWRGWWDFGTGAMGDMGCHIVDHPVWALNLGAPTHVESRVTLDGSFLEGNKPNYEMFPIAAIIYYDFPARGNMPPVKLTWYDGGLMPPAPPELRGQKLPDNGVLYVGSKGKMYHGSHGGMPQLLPAELHDAAVKVPKTMERSPGHYEEWVNACRGGKTPVASYAYSGPMTEIVLLGVLSLRAPGTRLEWDGENMKVKNAPELNQYTHIEYRKGYSL